MSRTEKDELLIALLAENARAPVAELARRLGLSRTTVQARIERLEREGVIAGYAVRISEAAERALIRAHILMTVKPKHAARTIAQLKEMREVRTLHSVSGEVDLIAMVAAGSVAALDSVVDRIGELDGVERTQTSIILATKIDR
ncbi:Lrp/AsnC family transcriptional regulator [Aureimonas populi]|uniref:Lrp/AsnC family transcriptional regulator n=1 Tax=Aureimonas populi TaxID=1701758 RepID=A0ABW5CH28_9HYPH|nr:Lrp/AsnC family transcriptional regulator [Aureimonas populi]